MMDYSGKEHPLTNTRWIYKHGWFNATENVMVRETHKTNDTKNGIS